MPALTAAEHAQAKANWQRMHADMREFVTALVAAGLADGRPAHPDDGSRMLAHARVAVHLEQLDLEPGVQPCITTAVERQALCAISTRGARK